MKKSILKAIPAAILASVCLTTAASAYLDMGESVTYSVKSNAQTWDNQNNSWAWYLHTPTDCHFNGTVTTGCKAEYTLYEWIFAQNEYYITGTTAEFGGFSLPVKQDKLAEDDYFARVEYISGSGVNNGYLTFKKG